MNVEIFTHKNCTECSLLLEFLEQKGLLGKVKVIDTELYPFIALERGVISTPSVFIDGKLIYAGTVDFEEFASLLSGNKVEKRIDKEDLADKLMYGITDSFAATAWIYVNRDFDSFMAQKDFVKAVTGLVLVENNDEAYEYLRNIMIKEGEKYLSKWEERMIRNISSNFIRELYWLYGIKLNVKEVMEKYPLETFAHWLMVRGGAVGRVGLRIHNLTEKDLLERVKKIYIFTLTNYDTLWEKVKKEQDAISPKEAERYLSL
ncbi:thioredoxin family protein [Candidatus Acidianus copahuensis]|uniref:Thioredoxin n=1 Tax=Candidatus Acidianus copahuensis TaxID=1160895 RepID=A0A031LQE7_9CREN|nr:thioredoxin family protein [Candidatus Acidianus copahuensis]EZQ06970.1 thioredoxin [Candidatus Acidianus copahuensis]NON62334.1 thioredoxin [Acidianus sp. RZ1]